MPTSYTDRKTLDEKFPDRQVLSEADDPGMVSCSTACARECRRGGAEAVAD